MARFSARICFLFLLYFSLPLFAQQSKLSFEICEVTRLINDAPTFEPTGSFNDVFLLDTIFKYSLFVCNKDTGEALLCACLSALPYNQIPIQIPFINFHLIIPIFSAEKNLFEAKNKKLPRLLSLDSPLDSFGDRDKSAHFFGAAFLAYSINSVDVSEYIGYFVEIIEMVLKISPVDERDVKMNTLGASFGQILRNSKSIKPSDVLLFNILTNVIVIR